MVVFSPKQHAWDRPSQTETDTSHSKGRKKLHQKMMKDSVIKQMMMKMIRNPFSILMMCFGHCFSFVSPSSLIMICIILYRLMGSSSSSSAFLFCIDLFPRPRHRLDHELASHDSFPFLFSLFLLLLVMNQIHVWWWHVWVHRLIITCITCFLLELLIQIIIVIIMITCKENIQSLVRATEKEQNDTD